MTEEKEIPSYVLENLQQFHAGLTSVEDKLEEHYYKVDFEQHLQREPLAQARSDLMALYTANSLFWMYLCTKGEDPSDNEQLKNELTRIKKHLDRLKQLEDRVLRPQMNRRAARNFVRNALFDPSASSAAAAGGDATTSAGETPEEAADQKSSTFTALKTDTVEADEPGEECDQGDDDSPAAPDHDTPVDAGVRKRAPAHNLNKKKWSALVDQELTKARQKTAKKAKRS